MEKTTLIFAKTLVCPCHAPRGGQIFLDNELHDTKGNIPINIYTLISYYIYLTRDYYGGEKVAVLA